MNIWLTFVVAIGLLCQTAALSRPIRLGPRGDQLSADDLTQVVRISEAAGSAAQGVPQAPSDRLNPDRPHIQLFLEDRVPKLRFFARQDLSGPAVVELNEMGLFVHGQMNCSWPGGRYDTGASDNMVLGYEDQEATAFRGCSPELPIRSFWYEEFGRHARLYIEIARRRSSVIEVRYRTLRLYADLNSFPGDPREPNESYHVRPKGFTGWAWWRSGREYEREHAANLAQLRKDRSLTRFLREARACLTSEKSPECFGAFVKPGIYLPEAKRTTLSGT